MLYKFFHAILLGMSPWTASLSLSTAAIEPQSVEALEIVETKTAVSIVYPHREEEVKNSLRQLVKSDPDVLNQFEVFTGLLKQGIEDELISEKDAELVLDAAVFGANKHQKQTKVDGKKTPIFIHPVEVTSSIMSIGHVYARDVLIAALLQDIMDDTGTSYDEITSLYGTNVSSYVKEMTTRKDLPIKERQKEQIMKSFHQSPSVAIIKYADKLSNLKRLSSNPPSSWTRDRIDRYFIWAQAVIDNLPEVNSPLKEEIKKVIFDYWTQQQQLKNY